MDKKNTIINILICLAICAIILSFRHLFIYPEEILAVMTAIEMDIAGVIAVLKLEQIAAFLSTLPPAVLMCGIGAGFYIIGLLLLKLFSRKMQIGSDIISLNLAKVIKTGLLVYTMFLILILVFVYSVVGIPIAFLLIVSLLCFNIVGNVSVAVFIGRSIQEIINGNDRRIGYNYIIGVIFMLFCINVYAVGGTFLLFIFPVLSLGTVACIAESRALGVYIDKKDDYDKKDKFDRKKIKDIITSGLK